VITSPLGQQSSLVSKDGWVAAVPLVPYEWNVVVVGRWNRAILTPAWVVTQLFREAEGTAVFLEVPMDAIGPYRITHRGLIVVPDGGRLIVETREANYDSLQAAKELSDRAIGLLPVTPLSAAGYNIRFRGEAAEEQLRPLLDLTAERIDESLERAGRQITRKESTRAVRWDDGKVSIQCIFEEPNSLDVNLNFERAGTTDEMRNWLQRPVEQVKGQVDDILHRILGV